MFLLPVLFLLFRATAMEPTPTFEYEDSSTGETLICDKCPPGTYMAAYCTATTRTQCAPCRAHHFTELWNYLPECLYCGTICTENQEVATECTATSNRVCRCKEGFYLTADFCIRHSECGPGQGVQTRGTLHADTVCETCSEGYFSASSSALESCVKQRECASGQIALLSGCNIDTVCGSCEDLASGGETLRTFLTGFFSVNRIRAAKMRRFVARYIHKKSDGTLPKQKGPLMDQVKAWLAEAPEEELKKLPEMLKASQLCVMKQKLESTLVEIKQQSPNCSLPLLDI